MTKQKNKQVEEKQSKEREEINKTPKKLLRRMAGEGVSPTRSAIKKTRE
jgi:hypothetical protein